MLKMLFNSENSLLPQQYHKRPLKRNQLHPRLDQRVEVGTDKVAVRVGVEIGKVAVGLGVETAEVTLEVYPGKQ